MRITTPTSPCSGKPAGRLHGSGPDGRGRPLLRHENALRLPPGKERHPEQTEGESDKSAVL